MKLVRPAALSIAAHTVAAVGLAAWTWSGGSGSDSRSGYRVSIQGAAGNDVVACGVVGGVVDGWGMPARPPLREMTDRWQFPAAAGVVGWGGQSAVTIAAAGSLAWGEGGLAGSSGRGGEVVAEATTPARYWKTPAPEYPRAARERGWEGTTLLRVEVLADGTVGDVEVSVGSGFPELDEAAMTAVREWKFWPARRGDERIRSHVEVPVRFRLERG